MNNYYTVNIITLNEMMIGEVIKEVLEKCGYSDINYPHNLIFAGCRYEVFIPEDEIKDYWQRKFGERKVTNLLLDRNDLKPGEVYISIINKNNAILRVSPAHFTSERVIELLKTKFGE